MKFILSLGLLALLCFSCKKEEERQSLYPAPGKLSEIILETGTDPGNMSYYASDKYWYDSEMRIAEIHEYGSVNGGPSLKAINTFHYHGSELLPYRVDHAEGADVASTYFFYDANNYITRDSMIVDGSYGVSAYRPVTGGIEVRISNSFAPTIKDTVMQAFAGSHITSEWDPHHARILEFQYDNKRNPFSELSPARYLTITYASSSLVATHGIYNMTDTRSTRNTAVLTSHVEYTYPADGLPVSSLGTNSASSDRRHLAYKYFP